MEDKNLIQALHRYFENKLTGAEQDELMLTLAESGKEASVRKAMEEVWASFYTGKAVLEKEKSEALLQAILNRAREDASANQAVRIRNIGLKRWKGWYGVAAAILVILVTGSLYWLLDYQQPPIKMAVQKSNVVTPGMSGAILTLSNGQQYVLDSIENGVVVSKSGTVITNNSGKLSFNADAATNEEAVFYSTMTTPRGRQYQLMLPDGSKVWLNAASSVHFPNKFNANNRTVVVKGEAYFEVVKDETKPFRVIADNGMRIEVLGTAFNVMAYDDNDEIKTTLVKGAVRVSKAAGASVVLTPFQEAVFSRQSMKIKTDQADLQTALAWKEGYFEFKNEPLPNVLQQFARWYDVDFIYNDSIANKHYTGSIRRQASFQQVLDILNGAGLQYSIKDRKISIL